MIDPAIILERAADLFGVSVADILGRRRFRHIARARHAVIYVLWKQGITTPAIGSIIHRDHSTVCSSIQVAEDLATDQPAYAALLHALLRSATAEPEPPPPPHPERGGAWLARPSLTFALAWWGVSAPRTA
jgi:hypothetical protein